MQEGNENCENLTKKIILTSSTELPKHPESVEINYLKHCINQVESDGIDNEIVIFGEFQNKALDYLINNFKFIIKESIISRAFQESSGIIGLVANKNIIFHVKEGLKSFSELNMKHKIIYQQHKIKENKNVTRIKDNKTVILNHKNEQNTSNEFTSSKEFHDTNKETETNFKNSSEKIKILREKKYETIQEFAISLASALISTCRMKNCFLPFKNIFLNLKNEVVLLPQPLQILENYEEADKIPLSIVKELQWLWPLELIEMHPNELFNNMKFKGWIFCVCLLFAYIGQVIPFTVATNSSLLSKSKLAEILGTKQKKLEEIWMSFLSKEINIIKSEKHCELLNDFFGTNKDFKEKWNLFEILEELYRFNFKIPPSPYMPEELREKIKTIYENYESKDINEKLELKIFRVAIELKELYAKAIIETKTQSIDEKFGILESWLKWKIPETNSGVDPISFLYLNKHKKLYAWMLESLRHDYLNIEK